MQAKKAMRAATRSTAKSAAKKSPAKSKSVKDGSTAAGGVAEYIAGIPESSRRAFDALRAAVRQAAPKDAEEVLSYGIVALRTERVLVWYAAFAKHCSLFPTAAVLEQFKGDLKGYKVSKGTVQFPLDKPLPVQLVKKLVRARVVEAAMKRK